jgi:hypothetical protein
MLTSSPQQCVRYLIARSPSAGEFREHFDCPTYIVTNQCIVTLDILFILCRVDPLLRDDREIGDYTAVIARQRPTNSNRGMVISVRSMLRCYKQDNWRNELVV